MHPWTRQRLHLTLALVLVAAPFWTPIFDDTDYEYRRAELDVDWNGHLYVVGDETMLSLLELSGFDCQGFHYSDRGCQLEYSTREVNATVDDYSGSADRFYGLEDYVLREGVVYRRTASIVDEGTRDERLELGLERVEAETALADVANSNPSRAAERVIERGVAVTENPVPDENRVLEVDGRYYVVYQTDTLDPPPTFPGAMTLFEVTSVVTGTVLFL